MRRMFRRWAWLALIVVSGLAMAQAIDPLPFRDHAEELRFSISPANCAAWSARTKISPIRTQTSRATCATKCSS
jgi:hypothetical protein